MNFPRAALRQAVAEPARHCRGDLTRTFVDGALHALHLHEIGSYNPPHVLVRQSWFPGQPGQYVRPTGAAGSSFRFQPERVSNPKELA
jgi:hypothetical protein